MSEELEERRMLSITEYLLVRFQNRFGIPKWRILVYGWCFFAVLGAVRALIYNKLVALAFAAAPMVITMWCWIGEIYKREQEQADRATAIIPNSAKRSVALTIFRWATVMMLIVDFIPPVRLLDPPRDALMLAALCLGQCDTFPMIGPTLKDRVKALFTTRKTATDSV